ncbi:MAG: hypothetical protein WBX01_04140 [Nitrososphaeraceae archaeon]
MPWTRLKSPITNIIDIVFLKRDKNRTKWKIEYEETIYKIYDRNNDLAGYFFPDYRSLNDKKSSNEIGEDDEEIIIEAMNQQHKEVPGGEVLVPLVKLDLLDVEDEHVDLDFACERMEEDLKRMGAWKTWMRSNSDKYNIMGNGIYTSREDRNMLSIALQLDSIFVLHEKEVGLKLEPILNSLAEYGLL